MRTYFSRPEQYAAAVLLLALLGGLFMLAFAIGRRQRETAQAAPFLQQPDPPPAGTAASPPSKEIVVHVTGAVRHSGVYHFLTGARVDDVIRQAGGATPDAFPDALNLAARLEDGERIYIPTRAEWKKATAGQDTPPPLAVVGAVDPLHATSPASPVEKSPPSPGKADKTAGKSTVIAKTPAAAETHRAPKQLPKEKINLNTATADKLAASLPGVGQVTAQRIIDYRKQHGKFTSPADLLNIPGIGEKTFKKIEPYVTL